MHRIAIILAILASLCSSFSQEKKRTNLEIFDETISAELEKIFFYPGMNREVSFIFSINPEERGGSDNKSGSSSKYLGNLVKKTASENELNFSIADNLSNIKTDSAYNLVVLQIIKLETLYRGFAKNKFLGEKTLLRSIIIDIAVDFKAAGEDLSSKRIIKYDLEDEIDFDSYKQMESPLYDFTRGEPPLVSTFERIIFPVLIICVTAAATILFFTIRSK